MSEGDTLSIEASSLLASESAKRFASHSARADGSTVARQSARSSPSESPTTVAVLDGAEAVIAP
ncbi:MAG TPA: hypothetical protein VFB44_17195 [Thermoleophilaceae bacterium]|nr:hypothetical protein [Thermoleophilaceae bacterium]